ncbi:MAG TPA: nucleotidyltransferase family protein [Anaeromyxobacter sp.]|nr:nucleotidyltransferase family protein [Anaeromyxobacter sp.]
MDRSGARVAGLLPAAGASTRLGRNKLLLEVGGEPLIRRAVRASIAAGLDPVVVVLAPGAEPARAALSGLACRLVVNPDPSRGQGSSLMQGIAALPGDTAAAVVVLPDMPRVTTEMIVAIVARWRQGRVPLVLSDYAGIQAPPSLYERPLLEELEAGGGNGKAVAAVHRAEAATLTWPAEALFDLDTPQDLAAFGTSREEVP